jgi:hypothetical protein
MGRAVAILVVAASLCRAAPDPREIVRQCMSRFEASAKRYADFAFVRHWDRKDFNSDGSVQRIRSLVVRREHAQQSMFDRVLVRDGQPVVIPELREVRPQDSDAEVKKLLWIREAPDALDYQFAGQETTEGRTTLVLSFHPRPGYHPKSYYARAFTAARGKMRIDAESLELVSLDAETFNNVDIGWGLVASIEKGTAFHLRQKPVSPESWLIESQSLRLLGKALLGAKSFNSETTTQYSEYTHR